MMLLFHQNIDTLEAHTGIDAEALVEAHGSFKTGHCVYCGKKYEQEEMEGINKKAVLRLS